MISVLNSELYFVDLIMPDNNITKLFFYGGYLFDYLRFDSILFRFYNGYYLAIRHYENKSVFNTGEKSNYDQYLEEYYLILENLGILEKEYLETKIQKKSKIKRYMFRLTNNKGFDFIKRYKSAVFLERKQVYIMDIINEEYKIEE